MKAVATPALAWFVDRILTARFEPHGRSYEAVDCWGVIYLYYRDVCKNPVPGYESDYEDEDVSGTRRLANLMLEHEPEWFRVERPRAGDVALFNLRGRPVHVGLMIDQRRALHAERRIGVVVEPVDSLLWAKRLEGVYRRA